MLAQGCDGFRGGKTYFRSDCVWVETSGIRASMLDGVGSKSLMHWSHAAFWTCFYLESGLTAEDFMIVTMFFFCYLIYPMGSRSMPSPRLRSLSSFMSFASAPQIYAQWCSGALVLLPLLGEVLAPVAFPDGSMKLVRELETARPGCPS